MSWEPIKFNFNYIIQKDQIFTSEELPSAVEVVSSAPIIFTSEEVIEEKIVPEEIHEDIPQEVEMVSGLKTGSPDHRTHGPILLVIGRPIFNSGTIQNRENGPF